MVGRIGKVNEIAERIGGKVRGLDEELLRVREAGERLNEVMELKVSLCYRWGETSGLEAGNSCREGGREEGCELELELAMTLAPAIAYPSSLLPTDITRHSPGCDPIQGLGDGRAGV